MKIFAATVLTLLAFQNVKAQQINKKFPLTEDVSTISGIIKAAYEVVSGEAGTPRQWERDLSLHDEKAICSFDQVIDGKATRAVVTEKEFQGGFDKNVKTSFYEIEINREVRMFGNVAHVWSTYETRNKIDGPVVGRGINSIQLYYKENRWWILSWNWDSERETNKIPKSFDRN